jgi:hypothetical protein
MLATHSGCGVIMPDTPHHQVVETHAPAMIRIAISQAAFDAIAGMLPFPLGSVSYENASNAKGERYVWLDPKVVEHLRALRGPERALQRRHIAAGGGGLKPAAAE